MGNISTNMNEMHSKIHMRRTGKKYDDNGDNDEASAVSFDHYEKEYYQNQKKDNKLTVKPSVCQQNYHILKIFT